MCPTWLIEAGVYGDEATPLLEEIHRQGLAGDFIPHQALKKGSIPVVGGRSLAPGACVIGYGTFPFARQIQIHHLWVPGAWCSAENLDCTRYFTYFGKFLLNQQYSIMTGVEAIRQCEGLFSVYGKHEEVFARPTSCHKLFVGRRVTRNAFLSALAPTRYDPATQVVIAAPKQIAREWRVVVADDRVIAGSQYAVHGERAIDPDFPAEVMCFAETILSEVRWRPDPIFMLDLCESAGRLWLVELNSFSGSWLYRCNLSAVVSAASELAARSCA